MSRDISGWIGAGITVSFCLALYVWSSYQDIYERRPAYLYDPQSDDVYFVELGPHLSRYSQWEVFVPFNDLHYIEPDGAEYVGKLRQVLKESEADRQLLESDLEAWSEKNQRELDDYLDEIEERPAVIEYWDVEYYPRRTDDAMSKLPAELKKLFVSEPISPSDVLMVDAVVARSTYSLDEEGADPPASISILRDVILLRGDAVYLLHQQGL